MKFSLTYLQYFLTVCDVQSFTVAAQKLGVTQSAISQGINCLEKEVGFSLLERKGNGFVPTSLGDILRQDGKKLLEQYDAMISHLYSTSVPEEEKESSLCIGFLNGALPTEIAAYLSDFKNSYPQVSFSFVSDTHQGLWDGLKNGRYQLIVCDKRNYEGQGVESRILSKRGFAVDLPSSNLLSEEKSISLSSLSEIPCLWVCDKKAVAEERDYLSSCLGLRSPLEALDSPAQAGFLVKEHRGFFLQPNFGTLPQESAGTKRVQVLLPEASTYKGIFAIFKKEKHHFFLDHFVQGLTALKL